MKQIFYLVMLVFATTACTSSTTTAPATNGFGPYEGQSVYLGDQEYVDTFKKLDAAWANRDYETMKSMIMDGGTFNFEDGTSVTTGGAFVAKIEEDYQNAIANNEDWGWKTDYAFAAYPDGAKDTEVANQKGQWVNAQFTSPDATYIEWYQFVDGKLITWYQAKGAYVFE
ncbi:MAG: hypothetical protein ACJ0QD_03890 [Flavobacteriaceae bacterium]|jgi:hypothetical protein